MNGIDYDLLRLGAWALAGLSLFDFALTASFDLGIGTLLPVLRRNDAERGRLIRTIEGATGRQPDPGSWSPAACCSRCWPPVH